MTNEECLNICKIAIKCFESKYSETLPVNNDCLEDFINQISKKEEERQAISIIRDALEKQIPKKPRYEKWLNSEYWYCPACNEVVLAVLNDSPTENEYNHRCCGGCGQRILWEETEDWSENEE